MRLLISDADILIEMEAGALMETLFQLPIQFGIPDLLYYEEIEPGSPVQPSLNAGVSAACGICAAISTESRTKSETLVVTAAGSGLRLAESGYMNTTKQKARSFEPG